jgi:hypothetical protein
MDKMPTSVVVSGDKVKTVSIMPAALETDTIQVVICPAAFVEKVNSLPGFEFMFVCVMWLSDMVNDVGVTFGESLVS